MSVKKRLVLLICILTVICLSITSISLTILYKTSVQEERDRLTETVQSQARLIEAVARFDSQYSTDYSKGAFHATLHQIEEAHRNYKGIGETGEFALAKKEGSNIVFLLSHRHHHLNEPKPVPFDSKLAAPMRMALSGESGTIIGIDYRGEKVLAAYEPIKYLDLGIVAKIDLSEIRKPFVIAGTIVILIMSVMVLLGAALFVKITNPVLKRLENQNRDLYKRNQELKDEIAKRKQAEKSLQQSEARFRELAELLPETIFETDVDGNLTFANRKAFEIFGYSTADFDQGLKAIDMIDCEDRLRAKRNINRILRGENIGLNEYQALKKDGSTFSALVHSTVIFQDGETVGLRGFAVDISEKKRLEKQVIHTQKLESIGNLAGGIAHDFNNILSSIIGFTELALDEAPKGSSLDDSLQEVYTAAKRAKDLVRQILAFARQSDENKSPVQPGAVAKEVLKLMRSTIPATIEIQQKIESEALIWGNTTQVHQVLMNLCTNAAQAMEDSGGVLSMSLKDLVFDKKDSMAGMRPGGYVEIKLSDTGVGIAPENIESIFEPYFTTKGPGEGTGMGLALVQGVIESYGGKITVASQPGKGTTFTIYLPTTKKRSAHDASIREQLPTGTERILFVDDEYPIVKMARQMLESFGYLLTTRTSSIEALELFKNKPDHFDLVITDMTMPNMTGERLAVELRKIRPDIPVILCTGYSKKISDASAAEIGITAFAYKPMVKADLAKLVRKVLDEANG